MMTMIADDGKLRSGFAVLRNVLSALGAVALIVVPLLFNMVIEKGDRAEALRLAEYQAFAGKQEEFNTLLNVFTDRVARGQSPSPDLVTNLTTNLVQQFAKAAAYKVNIAETEEPLVERYQVALNEVKKHIQTTDTVEDLNPLGVSLVEMYRSLKELTPVMERAAGKPGT